MPLESATYISDLVVTNPVHATDDVSAGDDHIRLIKSALKNTFSAITGEVTVSHTVINGVQDASNLASGTVADARLSSNVPLLNATTNVFTGAATFGTTLGVTGNVTLAADLSVGGNLTLTGTLNSIAVTDFARLSQAQTFTGTNTVSVANSTIALKAISPNGSFRLYGSVSTGGSYIEVRDGTDLSLGPLTIESTTMALTSNSGITISGPLTTPNSSASEVGYKGTPVREVTSSGSTTAADSGKTLYVTIAGGGTVTIDGSEHPDGTVITFISDDSSTNAPQSIAISDDTMYLAGTGFATTGTRTLAQGGMATAVKFTPTAWMINGAGLS